MMGFGRRKEIELFGERVFAYVYVDNQNILPGERNHMLDHPEEYAALKDREKDWISARFGYFVLLPNKRLNPADLWKDLPGPFSISPDLFTDTVVQFQKSPAPPTIWFLHLADIVDVKS